jgi:LemA protein
MRLLIVIFTSLLLSMLGGCGYNALQRSNPDIKAAWADVLNPYQRCADLVPSLVSTVRAEAAFEQETLTRVVEARSRATLVQAISQLVDDPVPSPGSRAHRVISPTHWHA